MNKRDQLETKPRIGRTTHNFGTNWYKKRGAVLDGLGIKHGTRKEIYAQWRKWIKDNRKTSTNNELAELVGLTVGIISTDASKMGLTGSSSSQYLLDKDKRNFNDAPYELASKQFSYNKKTGVIKWIGAWGRLSLQNIGKVVNTWGTVIVKSRSLSYRQLVWLLHTKKMPDASLRLIEKDSPVVFSNLEEISEAPEQDADPNVRTEEVIVLGRARVLQIDSSRPDQPKTDAGLKRASGYCTTNGTCRRYERCLDFLFECKCLGKAT